MSTRIPSLRDRVFTYVTTRYHSQIEYLWVRFPNYAVFRHEDNQKWYGLVMDVPGTRLGLNRSEILDILDVKLDDPLLRDLLLKEEGCFPGYHLSRGSWISVLLDGTVPLDTVCRLIDRSFAATASARQKQELRPPKEWLVPANPAYFDIVHAFDHTEVIRWKQGRGIRTGDTVFLYAAAPVSAILYGCEVTETGIPFHPRDDRLNIQALMYLRLQKRYPPDLFPFPLLRDSYHIQAIRGPRGVPDSLSLALKAPV